MPRKQSADRDYPLKLPILNQMSCAVIEGSVDIPKIESQERRHK